MHPLRQLRERLGLSQAELAQALGWSYSSIQQYERGAKIPPDRLHALKTFAAEQGHPDLAAGFAGGEWKVKRVVSPGETLISAAHPSPSRRHAEYHAMLDRILDSPYRDAKEAVQSNLVVFDNYVKTKQQLTPGRKKNAG